MTTTKLSTATSNQVSVSEDMAPESESILPRHSALEIPKELSI